jgi:hypothetical protein
MSAGESRKCPAETFHCLLRDFSARAQFAMPHPNLSDRYAPSRALGDRGVSSCTRGSGRGFGIPRAAMRVAAHGR